VGWGAGGLVAEAAAAVEGAAVGAERAVAAQEAAACGSRRHEVFGLSLKRIRSYLAAAWLILATHALTPAAGVQVVEAAGAGAGEVAGWAARGWAAVGAAAGPGTAAAELETAAAGWAEARAAGALGWAGAPPGLRVAEHLLRAQAPLPDHQSIWPLAARTAQARWLTWGEGRRRGRRRR
jgi:hypothetical protein